MSLSIVQSTSAYTTGTSSHGLAFPSTTTTGNILVCGVCWGVKAGGGQISPTSVGDGGTNTFAAWVASQATQQDTGAGGKGNYDMVGAAFWYVENCTGKASDTVTATFASAVDLGMSVWELSPGVHDQASIATALNTATSACPTLTPSLGGNICLATAFFDDGFGGSGLTAGSGYTQDLKAGGGNGESGSEHQLQTTAAAVVGAFSNSGASATWAASQAIFVPSGGSPVLPAMFSVSDPGAYRIPGIH